MQRLISAFPGGWPGCGLLLLRIAAAGPLFHTACPTLSDGYGGTGLPLRLIATVDGVFLTLGLATPFAAALQVLIEGWLALAAGMLNPDHGARALLVMALMMLGPGQYSLDSRLYGRKRIELER